MSSQQYFDTYRAALGALNDYQGSSLSVDAGQTRAHAYATLALAEAVVELAQRMPDGE